MPLGKNVRVRALRRIDFYKKKINKAEDKIKHKCEKKRRPRARRRCKNRQQRRIRRFERQIEKLKKRVPRQEKRKAKLWRILDQLKEDQDKKIAIQRKTLKFASKHKKKIMVFGGVLTSIAPFVAPFNPAVAAALVSAGELVIVGAKLLDGVNKGMDLAEAIVNVVEAIAHKEKAKDVLMKSVVVLEKAIDVADAGEKGDLVEKLKLIKESLRLMEKSIKDLKEFLGQLKKGNVVGIATSGIKLGKDIKSGIDTGKKGSELF